MKYIKNQRGFTAFEAILIILVLAAIGAASYFAYQARQDKTDYAVDIKHNQKATTSTQQAPAPNYGDPVARLQSLYTQYIPRATQQYYDVLVSDYKAKGLISANFSSGNGGEPVLCGQEAVPQRVNIQLSSKQGKSAILTATKVYSDGSAGSSTIHAEMTPNSSNQWALSKITCTSN